MRIRDQPRRIAGAPRGDRERDVPAEHVARGRDDLAHRVAAPRAEVDRAERVALLEPRQRPQVGDREILDVDVVADAGPVGSVVVVAEDRERRRPAEARIERERDQVGLGLVALAQLAIGSAPAALK